MKLIPLTRGLFATVDDADYAAVSQFKWHALKADQRFYAGRTIRKPDGSRALQFMHQFLMPGVSEVDHRDGNSLNNRKEENLRPATRQQNLRGFRRKKIGATSKFRGVSWDKKCRKWKAQISVDEKDIYLGHFYDETDAARAYDLAARKYFGEFASPNFPL